MATFNNKSVLGSAFDDFVQTQLKIRSDKLSSTEDKHISKENILRDPNILGYTVGKTAFARLSSGVNISKEIALRLFRNENLAGPGLAKNFILQSGTLNDKGGLRGGLSGKNSAYTIGGLSDFGFRPMPGIQGVEIHSKGMWGSLREASIKIKCFNRDQLSAIEILYCRPGYSILLEWGHDLFFNNDGKLINNISFMEFFEGELSGGDARARLHRKLLAKRDLYSGNYEGFIGPVSNFNITTNSDGTYDILVKAISYGYVIESLKINASSGVLGGVSNTKEEESDGEDIVELKPEIQSISKLESILGALREVCNREEYNNPDKPNHKIFIKNLYNKYLDQHPTGYSVNDPSPLVDSGSLSTIVSLKFKTSEGKSTSEPGTKDDSTKNRYSYLSLGTLLSIISKNCLIYNNPKQPSIVGLLPLTPNPPSLPENINPIVNINFNNIENYCLSSDYQISIDPSVCLIKYSGPGSDILGIGNKNTLNRFLPEFKTNPSSAYVGNTMNIMVNIDHILGIIHDIELKSDDREVYLHEFLERLMNSINLAMGKINRFNVGLDEETNTLTIYDKQVLDISPKEVSIINTMGLKSSVRNISIQTKIDNKLGSYIAIGAAAGNSSIGVDSSVLSQYNTGLVDRLMERKNNINSSGDDEDVSLENYLQILKSDKRTAKIKEVINDIYVNGVVNVENIEVVKSLYADILNTIKSKDPKTTASAIIPFTFDVTMDGLSGVKYGQMFSIEPERLPKSYLKIEDKSQPYVGFLVYNIDHSIINNTWTTTIKGQAAPLRGMRIKE